MKFLSLAITGMQSSKLIDSGYQKKKKEEEEEEETMFNTLVAPRPPFFAPS